MVQEYQLLTNSEFFYSTLGTRWAPPFDHNPNINIDDEHIAYIAEQAIDASTFNNKKIEFTIWLKDKNIKINVDPANSDDVTIKTYNKAIQDENLKLNTEIEKLKIEFDTNLTKIKTNKNNLIKKVFIAEEINNNQTAGTQNNTYESKYILYKQKYIKLKEIN